MRNQLVLLFSTKPGMYSASPQFAINSMNTVPLLLWKLCVCWCIITRKEGGQPWLGLLEQKVAWFCRGTRFYWNALHSCWLERRKCEIFVFAGRAMWQWHTRIFLSCWGGSIGMDLIWRWVGRDTFTAF